MGKYIVGFRSGKKLNMVIGSIYYAYFLLTLVINGINLSNISLIVSILIFPSLIVNFFKMILNWKSKTEYKKVFCCMLAIFIGGFITFAITVDNDNLGTKESSVKQAKNINDNNKKHEKLNSNDPKEVSEVNNVTNESELHFINTGNSDAILIKQGNNAALIDGGDNDDEELIVSYLKEHGVNELDYVFATHPHADHIGGLDAVVSNVSVKDIFVSNGDADTKTYSDFILAMSNKGLSPSVPLLNSEFKLGTSKLKVVSVANLNDPNNDSIVLEYTNDDDKVLLMGDAEKEIEENIKINDIDLLKIGHHGSNTSTSKKFIDMIAPEYAVILVGSENTYGHPHTETMETLKNKNIKLHRSDECGNIIFKSSGKGITTDCKPGSYAPGNQIEKSKNNIKKETLENETVKDDVSNNITETPSTETTTESNEVYWVPDGKVYHSTSSCSTLSRSNNIMSGSISESGKSRACKRCN